MGLNNSEIILLGLVTVCTTVLSALGAIDSAAAAGIFGAILGYGGKTVVNARQGGAPVVK